MASGGDRPLQLCEQTGQILRDQALFKDKAGKMWSLGAMVSEAVKRGPNGPALPFPKGAELFGIPPPTLYPVGARSLRIGHNNDITIVSQYSFKPCWKPMAGAFDRPFFYGNRCRIHICASCGRVNKVLYTGSDLGDTCAECLEEHCSAASVCEVPLGVPIGRRLVGQSLMGEETDDVMVQYREATAEYWLLTIPKNTPVETSL